MSQREETGFKRRGRHVHAAFQTAVEKPAKGRFILIHGLGHIAHGMFGKEEAEHAALPMKGVVFPRGGQRLSHVFFKERAAFLEPLPATHALELA